MSINEHVEMPTCNLIEAVHNKWLQQFGNKVICLYKVTCLYKAMVDDSIYAYMHITSYRL